MHPVLDDNGNIEVTTYSKPIIWQLLVSRAACEVLL